MISAWLVTSVDSYVSQFDTYIWKAVKVKDTVHMLTRQTKMAETDLNFKVFRIL